jgi:hypothetical protein
LPAADTNPQAAASGPDDWPLLTRVGFRFAFCYLLLYALCCGNATVWKTFPFIGERLELLFWYPFKHAAPWFGTHVFHLTGSSARLHMGVANDQALTWISVGILFVLAIAATIVWSALDRRKSYPRLLLWFRLALRVCIAASMVIYGMLKVFPSQMAAPSLAVLNEPVGNMSPMTLLWTLLGLHPLYESLCGGIEVLCGVLVLFRRTALAGALLTVFVVSNVVLYNYFFDVPVKIFSAHLLLMAVVALVPDRPALWNFFVKHRTATQAAWGPGWSAAGVQRETFILAAWLIVAIAGRAWVLAPEIALERANTAHPSPVTGLWRVDSATKPYLTADGLPMVAISLEPNGHAMLRASDQVLWRAVATYDASTHTLRIQPIGVAPSVTYAVTQPDATHLVLTPQSSRPAGEYGTLTLSRVPTPQQYPLLERGFHWLNEWGLER